MGADVSGSRGACKPFGHAVVYARERNASAAGRNRVRKGNYLVPESDVPIWVSESCGISADDGCAGADQPNAEFHAKIFI